MLFDERADFFLLPTRQFGCGFKDVLQPAFGSLGFWLGGVTPSNASTLTPSACAILGNTSPTRRRAAQFPKANVGRMDTQIVRRIMPAICDCPD